jgi:toxin-antitoxin system PIN domain toxin
MTSYLIDVNVWLAITWGSHQQNRSALRWYNSLPESTDQAELLFCRFTMLGFLRLLTSRAVMGADTMTLGAAFDVYDEASRDARVTMATEPRGTEVFLREAALPFLRKPATKAVADCYLAGFAEAVGAELVTFDKGLAHMARIRKNGVVLLEADHTRQ